MLPSFLFAQSLLWENTIVQLDEQYATSIAEADSGYLLYGTGRDIAQGISGRAEIVKIDLNGNLLWQNSILSFDSTINFSTSDDLIKVHGENNYYVYWEHSSRGLF